MIDRRAVIASAVAAGFAAPSRARMPLATTGGALADPVETIALWPNGAPGMPAIPLTESLAERSTDPGLADRAISGISRPRMAVFRAARPNGAAVLITPGGGYKWVVVDKEGYELARWLSARGITAFVLFYRLPGDGWAAGANVALSDAQRAMRLIRSRAGDYGIDPARVAALGFSAGGHVCADLAARFATKTYAPADAADSLPARPFLAAPIYPVIAMSAPHAHRGSREKLLGQNPTPEAERAHSPHLHIPVDAPPHFLVHAEDDDVVPVENTLLLRAALRASGIAVETHLFAQGGHGFGLRKIAGKPGAAWPELFLAWSKSQSLL